METVCLRNSLMKYVLAVVLVLIALPIVLGLIQFIIGTTFAILKLLLMLAAIVVLVAVAMRLLNLIPR